MGIAAFFLALGSVRGELGRGAGHPGLDGLHAHGPFRDRHRGTRCAAPEHACKHLAAQGERKAKEAARGALFRSTASKIQECSAA